MQALIPQTSGASMPSVHKNAQDIAVMNTRLNGVEEDFSEMKDAMKKIALDVGAIRTSMEVRSAIEKFVRHGITGMSGLAGILVGYFVKH